MRALEEQLPLLAHLVEEEIDSYLLWVQKINREMEDLSQLPRLAKSTNTATASGEKEKKILRKRSSFGATKKGIKA